MAPIWLKEMSEVSILWLRGEVWATLTTTLISGNCSDQMYESLVKFLWFSQTALPCTFLHVMNTLTQPVEVQNISKVKWSEMFCSEGLAIIKKCRLQLIFLSGYFFTHTDVILQRKMYTWLKQKEDKKRSIFPSMFPTYMNGLIYVFLFTFKICRQVCATMLQPCSDPSPP